MNVGAETAIGAVAATGVLALAWGAGVSARAAALGPEWARTHLIRSRAAWLGIALLGLIGTAVEPRWMGPAIAYIGFSARWMAGRVGDGIGEALALGPYLPPPAERRVAVLFRAVFGLAAMSALAMLVAVIAGFDVAGGVREGIVLLAVLVALLLGGLAVRLWIEGSRQLRDETRGAPGHGSQQAG